MGSVNKDISLWAATQAVQPVLPHLCLALMFQNGLVQGGILKHLTLYMALGGANGTVVDGFSC